jgi:hypothetical protein
MPQRVRFTRACAVARLGQGRRFWGAEIEAEICAIARRRVTCSGHRTRVRIFQITRLRTTLITRYNLWTLALIVSAAIMDAMSVQDTANQISREVESLTGCPVSISHDPSINRMATVEIARGPVRFHRIRIHPSHVDVVDYLISFQCGLILRKFALPPTERFDLAWSQKGRKEAEELVRDHYRGSGLPAATIKGFCDRLYDGLIVQLISIPLTLRVDSWIVDGYADLVLQQREAVIRLLQENLESLRPEIKKLAPEKIVKPSQVMNSALAKFWSRRWDDPKHSLPYRSINLGVAGRQLLETFDSIPSEPRHDRTLVDGWAKRLGLTGWYEWVPYRLDET